MTTLKGCVAVTEKKKKFANQRKEDIEQLTGLPRAQIINERVWDY